MTRARTAADARAPSTRRGPVRRSRLVIYLCVGYTLLVAYASLYPFGSWRGPPEAPLAFVLAPWPRYYTFYDLLLNVLVYVPLGFLLSLTALAWTQARYAALAAALAGTLLSLVLEIVQGYLPARVSSNLDLLSNGLGAMLGALVAVTGVGRRILDGDLHRLRQNVFLPGAAVDVGFLVLWLWLFTQLNPEVWLFGNGDIRSLLHEQTNLEFNPISYRWIETGVTAFNLAGICLLTAALARPGRSVAGPLLALVTAALALKSAAALTLFNPGDAALWLTPGAMLGIPLGLLLYLPLARLPRRGAMLSAATLILAGASLLNAAPENPYIQASVQTWRYGHFLSFNGLTQFVSSCWPLLAAGYLLWLMWSRLPAD
jgi:VanZ family protein